jgi:hypothetical protein
VVKASRDSATKVPTSFDGIGGRGYREKYADYLRRSVNAKVLLHLGRASTRFGIGATLQTDYSPAVLTRHFFPFHGYRRLRENTGDPFDGEPRAQAGALNDLLLVDPHEATPTSGTEQRQTPFLDLERGFIVNRGTKATLLDVRRACVCLYTERDGTLAELRADVVLPAAMPVANPEQTLHTARLRTANPNAPLRTLLCTALCNRHNARIDREGGHGRLGGLQDAFWRTTCVVNGGDSYLNRPLFDLDQTVANPVPFMAGVDAHKVLWQYRKGVSLMAAAVDNLRLACNLYMFELWERAVMTTCDIPEVAARWTESTPGKGCGGDATDFEHAAMMMTCLALWGEQCFDPAYDGTLYLEEQGDPARERHRAGTALMIEALIQYNAHAGTLRGKTSRRRRAVVSAETMAARTRDAAIVLWSWTVDTAAGRAAAEAATRRLGVPGVASDAELNAAAVAATSEESRRTFQSRVHERASALAGTLMNCGNPFDLRGDAKRAYASLVRMRDVDARVSPDALAVECEVELARVVAFTRGLMSGCYPGGLLYDVAHNRFGDGSCAW